jgi:hypothetical protein
LTLPVPVMAMLGATSATAMLPLWVSLPPSSSLTVRVTP